MTTFKHGDSVLCTIDGVDIADAKISIDSDGWVYICQNIKNGETTREKFGYKYSWIYGRNGTYSSHDSVSNLRLAHREYEVGDVLKDKEGKEIKVLGICGDILFLSKRDCIYSHGDWVTKDNFKCMGYSLYTPELIEVDGKKYSKEEILKLTPIL